MPAMFKSLYGIRSDRPDQLRFASWAAVVNGSMWLADVQQLACRRPTWSLRQRCLSCRRVGMATVTATDAVTGIATNGKSVIAITGTGPITVRRDMRKKASADRRFELRPRGRT